MDVFRRKASITDRNCALPGDFLDHLFQVVCFRLQGLGKHWLFICQKIVNKLFVLLAQSSLLRLFPWRP